LSNSASGIINGRYVVVREIGRGGTSSVYLCVDNHIGKQLAVKLIKPDKGNRFFFESEIAALKSLDYYLFPRITDAFYLRGNKEIVNVRAKDAKDSVKENKGEYEELIGIVTDYIEGESLEAYLKREGPLPGKRALYYFEELLNALCYLHNRSPAILYLDMKPANILITPEGKIRLVDFGIAGAVLTKRKCFGTPGFAPPEQYRPDGRLSERSDVFALGMTLYSMLTATYPDSNLSAQQGHIAQNEIIPKSIRNIILKCICEEEADRPMPSDLLGMIGTKRSKGRGVIPVLITTMTVCLCFALAVYGGVTQYRNSDYEKYAKEMVSRASPYMNSSGYTHQGIVIICGYIDGNYLDDGTKSKYAYEVGRYYFDDLGEYSTAAHYFAIADKSGFDGAEDYLEKCRSMLHFDESDLNINE